MSAPTSTGGEKVSLPFLVLKFLAMSSAIQKLLAIAVAMPWCISEGVGSWKWVRALLLHEKQLLGASSRSSRLMGGNDRNQGEVKGTN